MHTPTCIMHTVMYTLHCRITLHTHHLSLSLTQAKTEEEVLSERQGLQQELVWIVHKSGFTLGTLVQDSPKRNAISNHATFIRQQVRVEFVEVVS